MNYHPDSVNHSIILYPKNSPLVVLYNTKMTFYCQICSQTWFTFCYLMHKEIILNSARVPVWLRKVIFHVHKNVNQILVRTCVRSGFHCHSSWCQIAKIIDVLLWEHGCTQTLPNHMTTSQPVLLHNTQELFVFCGNEWMAGTAEFQCGCSLFG